MPYKCQALPYVREPDLSLRDAQVIDAAIIAAAQALEHYEITRYGALIAWATELGRTDLVPHFKANLAQEKATDAKLTAMAERRVNPVANRERGTEKPKSAARRKKSARRAPAKAKRAAPKKARKRA